MFIHNRSLGSKIRRWYIVLMQAVLLAALAAGCGTRSVPDTQLEAEKAEQSADEGTDDKDTEAGAQEPKAADRGDADLEKEDGQSFQGLIHSSQLLEDEEWFYICGVNQIRKIHKATGESLILWENSQGQQLDSPYMYSSGTGLLVKDKIYFMEDGVEEGAWKRYFSVIDTDGNGYEKMEELQNPDRYSMMVLDGVLYVDSQEMICRQLLEDGSLSDIRVDYPKLPEEINETYYTDSGVRTLFLPESKALLDGYLVREGNRFFDLAWYDPESGKLESLQWSMDGGEFSSWRIEDISDKGFLVQGFRSGEDVLRCQLFFTDKEMTELRPLAEFQDSITIIGMDQEYAYIFYSIHEDGQGTREICEKISLEAGERSILFSKGASVGNDAYVSLYLMQPVLKDGYIYYVGIHDYSFYLMRRNLASPDQEEILGETFYDTGISQVGRVETYYEEFYSRSEPGNQLGYVSLEWLVVDERFPGAEKINDILKKEQDDNKEYEQKEVEWLEGLEEEAQGWGTPWSYSSSLQEIAYADEAYVSFVQQDYMYEGGAHGMPLWIGYTFNLQTGERLSLQDVIENDQEELKEIVTGYYRELIEQEPGGYWENSVETVRETVDLDIDFCLDPDGIRFWMPPYLISSYARWYVEVTIPYEEFRMRITMG